MYRRKEVGVIIAIIIIVVIISSNNNNNNYSIINQGTFNQDNNLKDFMEINLQVHLHLKIHVNFNKSVTRNRLHLTEQMIENIINIKKINQDKDMIHNNTIKWKNRSPTINNHKIKDPLISNIETIQ